MKPMNLKSVSVTALVAFHACTYNLAAQSLSQSDPSLRTVTTNLIRNDRVNVARLTHPPRRHVRMHWSPPGTLVFLTNAHFVWIWPDGKRDEVSYKAGDAAWFPGGLQASESLDDHEERIMLVVPVDDPNPGRADGDPFIGAFKAAIGSLTVKFSRDGEWLIANVSNHDPDSRNRDFNYRAQFDGQEYPLISPPKLANTISLERRARNVIVETERMKGRVISVHTCVLSPDGKSVDHERLKIDADGHETATIDLLQRQ
jgi:hypothetical protein